jgi:hypothetical protein
MEDKELRKFSRTAFFLVTGLSFILFSKIVQLLDGARLQIFTLIGILAIMVGSLNGFVKFMERAEEK